MSRADTGRQTLTRPNRPIYKGDPMATIKHKPIPNLTPDQIASFHGRVASTGGPAECWIWMGSFGTKGYGQFYVGGSDYLTFSAPRIAYFLATGTDPGELIMRHSCDNPPCCNPAHLSTGTPKDNAADRDSRNRSLKGDAHRWHIDPNFGERNGNSKLTAVQVSEIRSLYTTASDRRSLASKFGVKPCSISDIVFRRTWTHI